MTLQGMLDVAQPPPRQWEVDVCLYGADPTGTIDSTAAIDAAIAAAPAGATLYFPRGTYLTSGNILTKQLRVRGDGWGSIIVVRGNTANGFSVAAAIDGIAIRDLQLQGTKTDEAGGAQRGVLAAGGSTNGLIENVLFSGADVNSGLNIGAQVSGGASGWRVRNCRFERVIGTNVGFGYGVWLQSATWCQATGCTSIQSAAQGRQSIYLSGACKYNLVAGNNLRLGRNGNIYLYAVEADDWCEANLISENECTANADTTVTEGAIGLFQKCRENLVTGNVISGSGSDGITVRGGTGAFESRCPDNMVSQNEVSSNGLVGIHLLGCDRCVVLGNHVYENSQTVAQACDGITVEPGGANTPTQDNVVIGNSSTGAQQRAGLRVALSGAVRPMRTVIRGNELPEGGSRYIQNDGDYTQLDEMYVIRRRVTYSDFSAGALVNQVALFTLGPGEKIESVTIKHETSFLGGAIAAYTVSVGIVGNYVKYAPAFDVFQATGVAVFQDSNLPNIENMATGETTIYAEATSVGAFLNAATQGEVQIHIKVRRYAMPVQ